MQAKAIPLRAYFNPRSPCGERHRFATHDRTNGKDFNPRSPCGERPDINVAEIASQIISIHALLAESDRTGSTATISRVQFQSTLSLRRATLFDYIFSLFWDGFQSTLSLRRATGFSLYRFSSCQISIHALLAESDSEGDVVQVMPGNFNPRSPCGERLWAAYAAGLAYIISIHALLAESDGFSYGFR